MPTALSYRSRQIPGVVLPWVLPSRETHQMTTKFFAVKGESRIDGMTAGRSLEIPVLVYSGQYNTQMKLSNYLEQLDSILRAASASTLVVHSSAGRPPFEHCSFDGLLILAEPKIDVVGSLGGVAFAEVNFLFRQHA